MNCIFILLCLLQIVYSSVDQNKHAQSAKDLQIQNYPMPKGYCWRITFYISRKLLSGTSNYITVQLINDETRVFSNRLPCSDKCERGSQPSFYFCTPQIDPVKEVKLNETVKHFWNGLTSVWRLESIDLMNLNTSAEYRCTLDYPGAEKKGCKLNPAANAKEPAIPYTSYGSTLNIMTVTTADKQIDSEENTPASVLGYCWRITFYISSNYFSGTSNYFTVQLINDETRVFSKKLSCAKKCKRGSQPSFDFCTPQIDPVKELKLNETVKNFFKKFTSGWRLESINLMNLNTSATYSCTFSNPGADEKGCKLNPKVIAM
uniref:Ig-like domain-containing protein n=1 Tax=Octopus bimaculoides TaxID=37653 RepID=A0A0L8GJ50_OCTBM